MARYIDIDKFVDFKCEKTGNCIHTIWDCTLCYANNGGAEDVTSIVHAKWFKTTECKHFEYICTKCLIHSRAPHNYCPNCGAKMDKE